MADLSLDVPIVLGLPADGSMIIEAVSKDESVTLHFSPAAFDKLFALLMGQMPSLAKPSRHRTAP